MVRPKKFVPLEDIKGLKTLIEEGYDNGAISRYWKSKGLDIGRMTISRTRTNLKL